MEEDQVESPGPGGHFEGMASGRRRDNFIDHKRRLQLQRFAEKIAADVMENTKAHERCLIRRMVENLLPGDDD